MKTIYYRYQSVNALDEDGFRYSSFDCTSDTNVTEEMCLRNEFGIHYLNTSPTD